MPGSRKPGRSVAKWSPKGHCREPRAPRTVRRCVWKSCAIDGKASLRGQFEVFGGGFDKVVDAAGVYDKLTRADIQKAAAQVLDKQHRTVGVLTNPVVASVEAKP